MQINDELMQRGERLVLGLQQMYLEAGYSQYRMSKFEEYDLYAGNKDFLISDNVITFTDTSGRLMALKPDVTLSIVKNLGDMPDGVQKVFYRENVYRVSKGTASYKEMLQAGLECIGKVGRAEVLEVIRLAAESLARISEHSVLALSSLDVIEEAMAGEAVSAEARSRVLSALGERNYSALRSVCTDFGFTGESTALLCALAGIHGPVSSALPELRELFAESSCASLGAFILTLEAIAESEFADSVDVDFSVVCDPGYYCGIVFKGYVRGVPDAVLSGGQYDRLMKRMQRRSRAIGFAVYADMLERVGDDGEEQGGRLPGDYLNIALPKGRLGEKIYAMFARAGYECPSICEQNRKLFFENPEKKVRYFWVKPSDVAIYVERGAADIGVCGKDILEEYEPDVYELLDTEEGRCRMAVAGPRDFSYAPGTTLRVATKFSSVAKKYYLSRGIDIDIIHLNGSIEIAPLMGLSDVIVDIVETGATLRENNLEVKEEIFDISARLISNKAAYKFGRAAIDGITEKLAEQIDEKRNGR